MLKYLIHSSLSWLTSQPLASFGCLVSQQTYASQPNCFITESLIGVYSFFSGSSVDRVLASLLVICFVDYAQLPTSQLFRFFFLATPLTGFQFSTSPLVLFNILQHIYSTISQLFSFSQERFLFIISKLMQASQVQQTLVIFLKLLKTH